MQPAVVPKKLKSALRETRTPNHCGNFTVYARFRAFARTSLIVVAAVSCGRAFAGSPPLITDDPETPGYHGWEINITESGEHTRGQFSTESPLIDINYGLTSDRDQLKVEFA